MLGCLPMEGICLQSIGINLQFSLGLSTSCLLSLLHSFVYAHVCTHVYLYAYVCMYPCVCICTYVLYSCRYMHICTNVLYAEIAARTYVLTYESLQLCPYLCTYVYYCTRCGTLEKRPLQHAPFTRVEWTQTQQPSRTWCPLRMGGTSSPLEGLVCSHGTLASKNVCGEGSGCVVFQHCVFMCACAYRGKFMFCSSCHIM